MSEAQKFEIFDSPAGFTEAHFIGSQSPGSLTAAVDNLVKKSARKRRKQQRVLFLVDLSDVPKIDISDKMTRVRQEVVRTMSTADYDRIAVYGNAALQILVNTLVMIAGKRDKIRVFASRIDALKWLKS